MGMVFSSDRSRACHPALTWPKMRGSGTRTKSKLEAGVAPPIPPFVQFGGPNWTVVQYHL